MSFEGMLSRRNRRRKKATRRNDPAPMKGGRKTRRRKHHAEGDQALICFEVHQGHVCIIDREGTRIPLFRAREMGTKWTDFNATLRSTIMTVMDNMDDDNGVC